MIRYCDSITNYCMGVGTYEFWRVPYILKYLQYPPKKLGGYRSHFKYRTFRYQRKCHVGWHIRHFLNNPTANRPFWFSMRCALQFSGMLLACLWLVGIWAGGFGCRYDSEWAGVSKEISRWRRTYLVEGRFITWLVTDYLLRDIGLVW